VSVDSSWQADVLEHYEAALRLREPLKVQDCNGGSLLFDVGRWLGEPDPADETVLARCTGPTLDVGCGPGRLVAALTSRGVPAIGVDVAATAVALTRSSGGLALRRSVFDRVPGAGRWRFALLADGNIGIGGDVGGLLTRVRELLAPGGRALVEVDGCDPERRMMAGITDQHGRALASFPWARIGGPALLRLAVGCGYAPQEEWESSGRCFVALQRI
jgi:SAM-dependent methyltransferase